MSLRDGLISWWELNESSGTRSDAHRSNDLTDNNTVGNTTGLVDDCAQFVRANVEYFSIPNASAGDFEGAMDFTISAWCNWNDSDGLDAILTTFSDTSNVGIIFRKSNNAGGQIQMYVSGDGAVPSVVSYTLAPTTNTWYHLVMTYNTTTGGIELFVDGSSVTTGTTDTGGPYAGSSDLLIGTQGNNTSAWAFNGEMDEFGFWDRILNQAEIDALYNSGSGIAYADTADPTDVKNDDILTTDLVSYWELEEASGTRTDSHAGNDLTDNNTVGSDTGKQGDGADFESSNSEFLDIADGTQSGLNITGDLSLALWYKFETVQNTGFVGRYYTSGNNRSFLFAYSSGLVAYLSSNGSSATNKSVSWTPSTGTWYHLAMTYDASAGSVKFYVNGSQQGATQTGFPTSLYDGSADFQLGGFNAQSTPSWTPDGVMDEVGVWSRVLSDESIGDLYNSGTGIPYEAGGGGETPTFTPIVTFF